MPDIDDAPMLSFTSVPEGQRPVRQQQMAAPVLRETVTVTPRETRTTYLLKDPTRWDWQDLQAYVVTKIIEIHGPFPRDDRKEFGTFKGFCSRYGADAGPIAKFAFEVADGIWLNAPISVNRFCKGSDPMFGDVIKSRLA